MNPYIHDLLVRDEGLRQFPYEDTATPPRISIGVGRNLTDVGLSLAEVETLLANDIEHVEAQAATFPFYASLDSVRAAVVLSMLFNLGMRGFSAFRDMITHLSAGQYAEAAEAMLASRWAQQVGPRALRLAEMMRTGVLVRR